MITAEFLPKTLFRIEPNFVLNTFSIPVLIFYILLFPITKLTIALSNLIMKYVMGINTQNRNVQYAFTRIDLDHLVNEVHQTEHDQQMEAQMISAMESGLTTPDKGLVTVNPYDGGIFFTREIEPGSNDFVTYQMTVPEGQNPADFLNGAHVEILDPRGNST